MAYNADIGGITEAGGETFDPETGFYFAAGAPLPLVLQLKSGVAWGTFGGAYLEPESVAVPLKLPAAVPSSAIEAAQPRLSAIAKASAGRGQLRSTSGATSSKRF